MAKKSMPLTRVIGKIPGTQLVTVKDYLTGVLFNDSPITANKMVNKLAYAQEVGESEVYGISIDNGILVIDICD